jgi:hypothetical protein
MGCFLLREAAQRDNPDSSLGSGNDRSRQMTRYGAFLREAGSE